MADRELLLRIRRDDFDITYFKAGGKGGQHQNKTDSACRIRHRESRAVAESRSSRHQPENRKLAFQRLRETPEWKAWFKRKVAEAMLTSEQKHKREKAIEKAVERHMQPENIIVQIQDNKGAWVTIGSLDDVIEDVDDA